MEEGEREGGRIAKPYRQDVPMKSGARCVLCMLRSTLKYAPGSKARLRPSVDAKCCWGMEW